MDPEQRALYRAAVGIRAELARRQLPASSAATLPVEEWRDLVEITRRIKRARWLGWHLAATHLADDQLFNATCLRNALDRWIDQHNGRSNPKPLPSATELYRDLLALKQEFGAVDYEGGTELWMTTEPIELEGILLGSFQIRLDLAAIREVHQPFRVVAVEPNPAATNDGVTHPHVLNENLCAGDGWPAIEKALHDWRLYDFFMIVRQILSTYSAGNAHVELESWNSPSCRDCGCSMGEDDSHCEGCNRVLCSDCGRYCGSCGYDYCSQCSSNCAHCDENRCQSCLSACVRCQAAVCSGCRDHEHEHETLCKKCHEREIADADEADAVTTSPRESRRACAPV